MLEVININEFAEKMKKAKIIYYIFFLLTIGTFLFFIIPIPINRVYDAVEIKIDDTSYIVKRQIKIHGKYYKNLFYDDVFNGQIAVSDYKLTNEKMLKVYFSKDGSPLIYYYYPIGEYDRDGRKTRKEYILGILNSKPLFRDMVICVFSNNPLNKDKIEGNSINWGGWNEQSGYCIVPKASNREEAINILLKSKVISNIP